MDLKRVEAAEAGGPAHKPTWYARLLSNTAWGLVRLGREGVVNAPRLYDAIAAAAPGRIAGFNPQDMSNMLWAFSSCGHRGEFHQQLFEAVALEAQKQVQWFNHQDFSNMAWAFATAGFPAPALFEAIAETLPNRKVDSKLQPQSLSNLVWAFA
ncbi:hypothetical protein M885DRAFT_441070, partial [Pelagophyceae sp. CCMP2097]